MDIGRWCQCCAIIWWRRCNFATLSFCSTQKRESNRANWWALASYSWAPPFENQARPTWHACSTSDMIAKQCKPMQYLIDHGTEYGPSFFKLATGRIFLQHQFMDPPTWYIYIYKYVFVPRCMYIYIYIYKQCTPCTRSDSFKSAGKLPFNFDA